MNRSDDMPLQRLQPINKVPVVQLVIDQVVSLIRSGDLKPGDRLPAEGQLVGQLAISRPSVREALRALEALGLIEIRPGQGSFVRTIDLGTLVHEELLGIVLAHVKLNEIMETRIVLEAETAKLAALNATDEDLKALEDVLDKFERAVDAGESVFDLAWDFHKGLAEATGNGVMARLLDILYAMIDEVERPIYDAYFDKKRELQAHRTLLEAVRTRNPEYARHSMVEHVRQTEEILRRALSRQ